MPRLRISIVWVTICAVSGCLFAQSKTEEVTEVVTLPTGEIITNESCLNRGRDLVRQNRLFFQQNAMSPRESLAEINEEDGLAISIRNAKPRIERSGDRTALLLDTHVFQRWTQLNSSYWYHATTEPNQAAAAFLHSFLPSWDSRVPYETGSSGPGFVEYLRTKVRYVVDRIDLDQNVLFTRRESSDSTSPKILVYSAVSYGSHWTFDIERTRSANQLKPPPDAGVLIDFSIVTYKGQLEHDATRDAALALREAKEIHAQTFPLSSSTWTTSDFPANMPSVRPVQPRFDALLGFHDPLPDQLSVFLRGQPVVLGTTCHLVKVGEWARADSTLSTEGVAFFFRIRQTQSR